MSQSPPDMSPDSPPNPQPMASQIPYPPSYVPPGYTPQYGFLPYYMTPPEALLGPAKRASWTLFALGALLLLATVCTGASVVGASDEMLLQGIEDMRRMSPEAAAMYTPRMLRTIQGAMAVAIGLCGVVAVILGVVVRGGGRAAAITALVLIVIPALLAGLMILSSLVGGIAAFLTVVLVMLLPMFLTAMAIVFLISAIRAAPQIELARLQMYAMHHHQQMQYQAYVQQQQQPPV